MDLRFSAPIAFRLEVLEAVDGERVVREREQQEKDKNESAEKQAGLPGLK
jgi:hypothetical protein